MSDITTNEPLLSTGTIVSVATAVLGAIVVFGVDFSKEQQASLLAVVAVLAPIVVAVVGRFKVTPSSKVAVTVNDDGEFEAADALVAPNGTSVEVHVDPEAQGGMSESDTA